MSNLCLAILEMLIANRSDRRLSNLLLSWVIRARSTVRKSEDRGDPSGRGQS
jgi:hypothetical protein